MPTNKENELENTISPKETNQNIMRDELIPNILAEDTPDILYWAGKTLVKKRNFDTDEQLENFFKKCGFGDLKLIKKRGDDPVYELSGPVVTERLKNNPNAEFMLETGLIAQAISKRWSISAEGKYKVKKDIVEISITTNMDTPPAPV